jgi:hypothetical protein
LPNGPQKKNIGTKLREIEPDKSESLAVASIAKSPVNS